MLAFADESSNPIFDQNDGLQRKDELEMRFSGSYYIRSDRTDLDEKELWELYMTLAKVEEANHMLVTKAGTLRKGERVYQRRVGDPEAFHLRVYQALGVSPHPLGIKRWIR